MILLKQSSRSLSCTIFILQSTFQVFKIGFGHRRVGTVVVTIVVATVVGTIDGTSEITYG